MDTTAIETVSPSVAIAAYDSASRDASARAPRPTYRMSVASIPPLNMLGEKKSRTSFLWWDSSTKSAVMVDHKQRPVEPYSPVDILKVLKADNVLVVDSPTTITRILSALSQQRSRQAFDARRLLTLLVSLPVSSRMPILTRALAQKMWLPTGLDNGLFSDWLTAHKLSYMPVVDAMKELVALCQEGEEGTKNAQRLTKIGRTESHLISGARYSGLPTACSAFNSAEKISDQWSALCAMDIFLRQRGVFDGTVSTGSVIDVWDRGFRAELSLPTKLKASRPLQVTSSCGTKNSTVELLSLSMQDHVLVADITVTSGVRNAGWVLQELAEFYVTALPFDGLSPSHASRKKWTSAPQEFEPRKVPDFIKKLA